MLSESILDKFSLGKHQCYDITVPESPTNFPESSSFMPPSNYGPNSHLSLLAMVDCCYNLQAYSGYNPFFFVKENVKTLFCELDLFMVEGK